MDYQKIVTALRAKADKTDFPAEAKILREKADEIEAKYKTDKKGADKVVINLLAYDFVERIIGGDFPADWYETMDNYMDTWDWYSGAE